MRHTSCTPGWTRSTPVACCRSCSRRARPFAHLARLDTWLAAQATGITIRGLRLDTGYARGLLTDLEAEHAAADARITAALGCPGRSPRFAEWLDAVAAEAGITGLARTPTGRLQVTTDTLASLPTITPPWRRCPLAPRT